MINQKGFTLLESLIYIALFSLIIGGGVVAAHQIVEASIAAQNHIILQEEANFLFRKINWALTGLDGSSSITTPAASPGYSDSSLVITKDSTMLTFSLNSGDMMLQRGSGSLMQLNSNRVAVSLTPLTHLFERIIVSGKPDAITVHFTLATENNGRTATQDFTTTKYLRK